MVEPSIISIDERIMNNQLIGRPCVILQYDRSDVVALSGSIGARCERVVGEGMEPFMARAKSALAGAGRLTAEYVLDAAPEAALAASVRPPAAEPMVDLAGIGRRATDTKLRE